MRNKIVKRFFAFVLASALIGSLIPEGLFNMTASAATGISYERVADHESIDYWKGYFSSGVYNSSTWSANINTQNAGAVWTDKSVFVPADTIKIDNVTIPVVDTGDNFLVSMSVMASNKTIKGYEYIPTSTMLVLDVSGSMGNGQNGNRSWDEMVEAANKAIDTLLNLNNNNLVGVVLYSGNTQEGNSNLGHSTLLLPLDRYTTTAKNNNGTYNTNDDYPEYLTASNSNVSVNSAVRPSTSGSKNVAGGTYVQGGLYRAMEEFLATDTPKKVEEGIQAGMAYTPIMVLMSDGAPTAANLDYDFNDTNNNNHRTDLGDGTSTNDRIGFLTQLTAAYTKARVDAAYEKDMLFYTLGLGLNSLQDNQKTIAEAVLSSDKNSDSLNTYWQRYLALDNDAATEVGSTMYLNNNYSQAVVKNDYVTSNYKNYVTQYFEAVATSGTTLEQALLNAFQQIVDAIVIQSFYYPTMVEGSNEDLGGYVVFRDELGDYMDVVNIKGFLFEDENGNQVLHTGAKLAANFVSGGGDLGQSSNPKPLGDELVRAVKERLGIADTLTAQNLIRDAYYHKQLSYVNDNNFSNYIGWYGDINGKFVGFWHDGHTQTEEKAAMDKGAKFIYKSYGYLGEVNADLGIKSSDMMYTAIRVRKTIAADVEGSSVGEIVVEGSIPASLIPTLTYEVTLKGKTYESGIQSVAITDTSAKFPARILYEVALRSDINPNTVAQKVGDAYKDQNGTYTFYTNDWKTVDYKNNVVADTSVNTFTYFEPSRENERYYYLTDSVVYSDDKGTVYTGSANPVGNGYYHEYRVFTVENGVAGSEITYVKTSPEVLKHAEHIGGQWIIPAGTGKHEIVGYEVPVKQTNNTGTNEFTAYPKIKTEKDSIYADHSKHYAVVTLGNNGRLSMKPEPIKKVYNEDLAVNPGAENIDGGAVMVGDILTYTIEVTNYESTAADITVADTIPTGTVYVDGSASNNGSYNNTTGKLTWTLAGVDAGASVVLSFKVQVTEAALSSTVNTINNTANITVDIGENSYSFDSNTTTNQTEGKKVVNIDGDASGTVKLGAILVYSIQFVNDTDTVATVTITDTIPEGTAFVSADHNGEYKNGVLTWRFDDVQPGHSGVVTFRAVVTAEAASLSDAAGTSGPTDDTIVNYATIKVGENNPKVRTTNETTNELSHGDLVLTKKVEGTNAADKEFTLVLTDLGTTTANIDALTGDYAYSVYDSNGSVVAPDSNSTRVIKFTAGVANVEIKAGQFIVIEDLPAGLILTVTEDVTKMPAGYTLQSIANGTVTVGSAQVTGDGSNGTVKISDIISQYGQTSGYAWPVITNAYSTLPASVTLVTTKTLENKELVGGEFSFVLRDITGVTSGSGVAKEIVSNDKDGKVAFSTLTFDNPGTYTYTVSEVKGSDDNVTYSGNQYTITIKVGDSGNGFLEAAVNGAYYNSQLGAYELTANGVAGFENVYTPDPVSLVLSGTKKLTGAGADGLGLNEFTFVLMEGISEIARVGNGAGDSEASFTFPTISYDFDDLGGASEKTFTYTVSEVKPTSYNPNMVYDSTIYTVKVKLSYDSGEGKLIVSTPVITSSSGSGNTLSFTNVQHPDTVTVTPSASKVTANKTVTSGDAFFTFVITDEQNQEVIYGNAPAVSAGDNDDKVKGNVKFSGLTYTAADVGKTYSYTMKEIGTSNSNGITYDTSSYGFSVTVGRDTNGALQATLTYDTGNEPPIFRNEYNAEGQLTLQATKKLNTETNRTLKDGEFQFKLQRENSSVIHYGTNDADGKIIFDTLYFTHADVDTVTTNPEYTYIMTEVHGNTPGMTYSDVRYEITVDIVDGGTGVVIPTITGIKMFEGTDDNTGTEIGVDKLEFVNDYAVTQGTSALISAKKEMGGRELTPDDQFSFYLYEENNPNPIAMTTNDVNGNISFTLDYPATTPVVSVYKYRIEEVAPVVTVGTETNGITYSAAKYYVQVIISDNNSMLQADVKYYQDADCTIPIDDPDKNVVFINEYTADSVIWTPAGINKVLTGRDLKAGEFTFELVDITDPNAVNPLVLVGTNKANSDGQPGEIVFDSIQYDDWDLTGDKIFKYKISEVVLSGTNSNGVTPRISEIYMTVQVIDDGLGSLKIGTVGFYSDVNCTQDKAVPGNLTNSYKAEPTDIILSGTKVLNNKKLQNGEFKFNIKGNGVDETVTNNENGIFTFSEIELKTVGNHEFIVTEVTAPDQQTDVSKAFTGTYTYDTAPIKVLVEVKDNGKGQLYVANTTYKEVQADNSELQVSGITFLNSYKPLPISKDIDASLDKDGLNVNVDKSVNTGMSGVIYDLSGFKFEVRDLSNNVVSTGTSDANGHIDFGKLLEFEEAGQYRFWISEVDINNDSDTTNDKPNVTFSDDVWELHVLVRYNEVTGVLEILDGDVAAYQFLANGTMSTTPTLDIDYVNVYEPEPVSIDINMSKKFLSAAGTSRVMQDHEFRFQIVDAGGKIVAETVNEGTDVKFTLTFDKVGSYRYVAKEVIGTSGGVKYDDTTHGFTVEVTDKDLDGKLEAVVNMENQNTVFENSYTATTATVVITAAKILENRSLVADEFTFELVGANGDVYTAKNDAAGVVKFEALTFEAVGTYKYTLTEKKDTLKNVIYSEAAYNVTIEVKDNLLGQLVAEVTYTAVDGEGNESIVSEPTFTNIFKPDPSAVIIDATKQLTGRDLAAGEFQFVVKDGAGNELATGTNTADGKIYFTEFKLAEGNDYKLYVSEVDTAAQHVFYDGATYMVLVDMINDGSGILKATVEYPDGEIIFRNEYKEPPAVEQQPEPQPGTIMTSFAFNATKVLTGRNMAAGEFRFQVKDSNGEVVATGSNDANGSVQFSPLVVFDPGRYEYTVSEINTRALNITYDTTVYKVSVDVERVGDDLTATINYPEGGLIFRNYVGNRNPLTGDSTPIGLLIALVLISGAGVAGLVVLKRKKK